MKPYLRGMLSAVKKLTVRPFAPLRVTRECANLLWFDLTPNP
jgi:hypothetical protein